MDRRPRRAKASSPTLLKVEVEVRAGSQRRGSLDFAVTGVVTDTIASLLSERRGVEPAAFVYAGVGAWWMSMMWRGSSSTRSPNSRSS
jgi:hypothetical protein